MGGRHCGQGTSLEIFHTHHILVIFGQSGAYLDLSQMTIVRLRNLRRSMSGSSITTSGLPDMTDGRAVIVDVCFPLNSGHQGCRVLRGRWRPKADCRPARPNEEDIRVVLPFRIRVDAANGRHRNRPGDRLSAHNRDGGSVDLVNVDPGAEF
jgi:hypothetical protein